MMNDCTNTKGADTKGAALLAVSQEFKAHVKELERRALGGDLDATKSLSAMALLAGGWRYGDE